MRSCFCLSLEGLVEEAERRPPVKEVSLPSTVRMVVIQWMMKVAHDLFLSRVVFHRAGELFDRVYAVERNHNLENNRWVAIGCLTVADKVQNGNRHKPKRLWLNSALVTLSTTEIGKAELFVLKNVDWNSLSFTAEDHLDAIGTIIRTDSRSRCIKDKYFEQMKQVLDLCMLDKECSQFNSVKLAFAILHYYSSDYHISWVEWISSRIDLSQALFWVFPFVRIVKKKGLAVDCTIQDVTELTLVEGLRKESWS